MENTIQLPEQAREKVNAFRIEREILDAKLQHFIDGVIIGMGIDVKINDVGIDLDTMTATVKPKEKE